MLNPCNYLIVLLLVFSISCNPAKQIRQIQKLSSIDLVYEGAINIEGEISRSLYRKCPGLLLLEHNRVDLDKSECVTWLGYFGVGFKKEFSEMDTLYFDYISFDIFTHYVKYVNVISSEDNKDILSVYLNHDILNEEDLVRWDVKSEKGYWEHQMTVMTPPTYVTVYKVHRKVLSIFEEVAPFKIASDSIRIAVKIPSNLFAELK